MKGGGGEGGREEEKTKEGREGEREEKRKEGMLSGVPAQHKYYFLNFTAHSNQRRKRNKRNTNWKGRSKTVTVCRRHDSICRQS